MDMYTCLFRELPDSACYDAHTELNVSLNDESNDERTSDEAKLCGNDMTNYCEIARKHIKNCKIGHINANSIAGFNFFEIKQWLIKGLFDILIITETKIDVTFPIVNFMLKVIVSVDLIEIFMAL